MKWEYKTIKMATHTTFAGGKLDEAAFDKMLNDLGGQGWELVAVFPLSQTIGETRDVVAAFKRETGASLT
jgi:hypothetical protein